MIWTTAYLERLAIEAEIAIAKEIPCIIDWYSLSVVLNKDRYQLPEYVQDVRAVYWKGVRLDSTAQGDLESWPIAYSKDNGDGTYSMVRGSNGKPTNYWYNSFGENVIKFFPHPNESIGSNLDGAFDPGGFEETAFFTDVSYFGDVVVVEFYRTPDGQIFKIPEYIRRRTIKAYVLMKAFAKEGDGQNLKASKYWFARYQELIIRGRSIIHNIYSAEIRSRSNALYDKNYKVARPRLPWNWQAITVEDED